MSKHARRDSKWPNRYYNATASGKPLTKEEHTAVNTLRDLDMRDGGDSLPSDQWELEPIKSSGDVLSRMLISDPYWIEESDEEANKTLLWEWYYDNLIQAPLNQKLVTPHSKAAIYSFWSYSSGGYPVSSSTDVEVLGGDTLRLPYLLKYLTKHNWQTMKSKKPYTNILQDSSSTSDFVRIVRSFEEDDVELQENFKKWPVDTYFVDHIFGEDAVVLYDSRVHSFDEFLKITKSVKEFDKPNKIDSIGRI